MTLHVRPNTYPLNLAPGDLSSIRNTRRYTNIDLVMHVAINVQENVESEGGSKINLMARIVVVEVFESVVSFLALRAYLNALLWRCSLPLSCSHRQ
jgi:hypothetical protein